MHIAHVAIKNFRALEDVDCPLGRHVNVIVGPNGVGKTTILQALRLSKALLAPRTEQEAMQVLVSLGASSPHFPQRVFLANLARDAQRPVEIRATYRLTVEEVDALKQEVPIIAQNLVATRKGQEFTNPTRLVSYFQSPEGKAALVGSNKEVNSRLVELTQDPSLVLGVTMNVSTDEIVPEDEFAGAFIGHLDRRLPPSLTKFSYFPADRALPMGEVNLQLGAPDAQQQLETHNSQPQLKYQRLKNLIVGALVLQQQEGDTVKDEFERIFSGLLRGRRIHSIGVNSFGLLSVMIEEVATGRIIELDSLSSGEKNIALTFLIVARSVAEGGIAIFDEPELHLNPAVSRELLPFIMSGYAKPKDIQFIMCTHAPEILTGAFSDEECTLLHLKTSTNVSRIGKHALDEHSDALSRLGTSVSESLMYDGTIIVEGVNDVDFLELGFPDIAKKYKVKDLGGRREVERTILDLQDLEAKHQKVSPIFLIFDRDSEPTNLKSSPSVKIMQWKRRCAENYLIDTDVIATLLKDETVTKQPVDNEGEVRKLMRNLAFDQLNRVASREVYSELDYRDASLCGEDFKANSITELADAFYKRRETARVSIPDDDQQNWTAQFIAAAEKRKADLLKVWEAKWPELCDGKRLIADLHKVSALKMSESAFKARIVKGMRETTSENWRLVRDLLNELLA